VDVVGSPGAGAPRRLSAFKKSLHPADPVAMATWLRRMFRPNRRSARSLATREGNAKLALEEALAEAEEWAAHATALARVLRETKAAARRLERSRDGAKPESAAGRTLH
jgi:hypothetical protein